MFTVCGALTATGGVVVVGHMTPVWPSSSALPDDRQDRRIRRTTSFTGR